MSGPRLVFVTQRSWPLVGGAERQIASLAAELKQLDCDVTILTAHWEARWPAEISHHGVRVVRLPHPAFRGWGTIRYMLAVGRWLRANRESFDLVYVSGLGHDAYATLSALGQDTAIPVVLRAEGAGLLGDVHWQNTSHFGHRIARRCQSADAVVAASPHNEQELLAAGYSQVRRIDNGVHVPEALNTTAQRVVARCDLARANPELTVAESAPVAVAIGRLHEAKGLQKLLAAWKLVVRQQPRARLWLVGEGPYRPMLSVKIEQLKLRRRVALAGTFDDVEQFHRAADLYVLPAAAEGALLSLLEAAAAGVPVVATDIPGHRHVLLGDANRESASDKHYFLPPPDETEPLAAAILRAFEQPEEAAQWAVHVRRRVGEAFSIVKMAERHLELFQQLIAVRQMNDSP